MKLKELWAEYKTLEPSDPRRKELQKEINRMEEWCISRGYEGFKITRFNDNEGVDSKNYPQDSGAIWFGDYNKLEEVIRNDRI